MMSNTYSWINSERSVLQRNDSNGGVSFVPTDPANTDYAEFLNSGATAADYVAPSPAPEPTAADKLSAAGLTVEELKSLLGL